MNRKLEIDISSDPEEHSPAIPRARGDDEEEEGEDEDYEEEEEEDQHNQYSPQDQNSSSPARSRGGLFEGVETFGNQQPTSSDRNFIDQLILPIHAPSNIHRLDETPIAQRPTDRQLHADSSSLQDEIARIISKVNKSHGGSNRTEERTRIGQINSQLLKENTGLISEINELQSKLQSICGKLPKKSSRGSPADPLLSKRQKYKEKLSRAVALNSKLSARLNTQRSRSNVISSTYRSVLNQASSHVSSLRSRITKNDSSEINPTSKLEQHAYCERCCKELAKPEKQAASMRSKSGTSRSSKELMFSPVLQVKNYQIAAEKSNQFQLSRKYTRQVHCQVNFEETASLDQMRQLQHQEDQLQGIIESNNKKILEYEQLLYRLVDLN